ncbi:hypothetical protein Tco_1463770, partial [Tanacetum coccineum]
MFGMDYVIDERGSFAVTSPLPGSLASLLQSLKKPPTSRLHLIGKLVNTKLFLWIQPPNRVALIGEVVPLGDKKVKSAVESLRETIISEGEAIKEFGYSVSSILSSSNFESTSRAENLQELLNDDQDYRIYKFNPSSITYIEGKGGGNEVDMKDMEESKADPL